MDYLYIDYKAINSIASNRKLQSFEFEDCVTLTNFLRGEIAECNIFELNLRKIDNGGYIFFDKPNINKGLIFDFNHFDGFKVGSFRVDQIITIFQKILKFSIRYWMKLPFTHCEKSISAQLGLVFPFPFTAGKTYKVSIDKTPDSKRVMQRGGNYLLVFNDGLKNDSIDPTYTNFRKAVEKIKNFKDFKRKKETIEEPDLSSLKVTDLGKHDNLTFIDSNIGFENWQHYLTKAQKIFVNKGISGPERLQGAAGTGKTLTMILRCINLLKQKIEEEKDYHLLFVTHSIATKKQIENIFRANYKDIDKHLDKSHSRVSVTIITLQEWCINYLGGGLSETEYLDRDAQDSKEYQLMYLQESFEKGLEEDFESYKEFCSEKFIQFIEKTPKVEILEMLQQEVAVTIKGRANESIEKYLELPRLKYSIPTECKGDKNFLYQIYEFYQSNLEATGQFDSDDIILSALGQLNTPIWRRRKRREGFNGIFIDETHLFNFNELSLFHHLNKEDCKSNIIFALDKSQAVGDKGLTDEVLFDSLGLTLEEDSSSKFNTVFRSSPDIINLAFKVLSSGATLFTNFENPLEKVKYSFTEQEERKSTFPLYILKEDVSLMVKEAFTLADRMFKNLETKKSKILIVSTSSYLLEKLESYANKANKPFELLKRRGDIEVVKSAEKSNRYILGGIDFVGGLEFDGVIIVGVDKSRVPPTFSEENIESFHFLNYSWHNRMYVAITRAKYSVTLIGEKSRGLCPFLESAIEEKIIKLKGN